MGCEIFRGRGGRELSARRAVEVVELALDRGRPGRQFMDGAARVLRDLPRLVFLPALFGCSCNHGLSLFQSRPVAQTIPVRGAHVVHGNRCHGLDARVDLCGADEEAPASADAEAADLRAVNARLRAEEVHGGAEVVRINVGKHRLAGFARAFAPEGEVDREGGKARFSKLLRVKIGALRLHGAHRVADHHRRKRFGRVGILGKEEVPDNIHLVEVVEGDLSHRHPVALIEVLRAARSIGGKGAGGDRRSHQNGKSRSGEFRFHLCLHQCLE